MRVPPAGLPGALLRCASVPTDVRERSHFHVPGSRGVERLLPGPAVPGEPAQLDAPGTEALLGDVEPDRADPDAAAQFEPHGEAFSLRPGLSRWPPRRGRPARPCLPTTAAAKGDPRGRYRPARGTAGHSKRPGWHGRPGTANGPGGGRPPG